MYSHERVKKMAVSYNKLYRVLEEKNITMVELRKAADIAPNTMTRIRKNEEVSLDVLVYCIIDI